MPTALGTSVNGFDVRPSWTFDDLAQALVCARARAMMANLLDVTPALRDRGVWRFLHDRYVAGGRVGRTVWAVVACERAYRAHPATAGGRGEMVG